MKHIFSIFFTLLVSTLLFASTGEVSEKTTLIPIGAHILDWAINMFGAFFVTIVIVIIKRWFTKMGWEISNNTETLIKQLVADAVNATEKWAKEQEKKPSSNEKLAKALESFETFAGQTGITKFAKERIEGMIETYLRENGFLQ